jgi:hypothetical protein
MCTGADPAGTFAGQAPERSKVYVVENASAMSAFQPRLEEIQWMVDCGITNLTGKGSVDAAWRSLVSTQDVVGIKVYSEPGPNSGTRQAVAAAVARGLLAAGLKTNQIVIWDRQLVSLRLAGYGELARRLGVRLAGSANAGYDENTFYESSLIGNLVWGDLEFGRKSEGLGRKSFVSTLVSRDITRIINVTPLMNHNEAGVAGTLYGLALGSVDNIKRFESDVSRLATAIPEIYALPAVGDKVVLNIVDALICQYEGEERSLLHYSSALNQLRFSRDPVALDVLSIEELNLQRQRSDVPLVKRDMEIYSNAALLQLGISDPKRIQVIRLP